MIPIRPLQDRVIMVKPEAEEVRPSGIVIPKMFDDAEEYEIVAVGPGRYGNDGIVIPLQVKVGDRVLCNKHQVQEIKLPDDPKTYFATRDHPTDGGIRAVL